jgi:hypothetical protein
MEYRWFENMSHFRCLRTTLRNQNLIHEEIKERLDSGNASYHSLQRLVFMSAVEKLEN